MARSQQTTHDITWEALFKVVAVAIGIWAVILLRDVIILMLVVFIFVAAVNPTIGMLQKNMSRSLAVTLFFVVLIAALVGIAYVFIPLVIRQLQELNNSYPELIEKLKPYLTESQQVQYSAVLDKIGSSISTTINTLSTDFISRGASFFSGVATFISGLIIGFYLLLEEKNAKEFFHQVLPRGRFQAVYVTVQKISEKMGYWIRGQFILMLLIAVANFIVYALIGVPTPLPLALWAGLCEAIPYIGPVLGMLPAIVISLIHGNFLAALLVFLIGFLVIQQIEASIIVPRVMGKAVGLSPVLVILAIVVGVKLFGVLGAIIAVPAAAGISVIVQEWPNLRKIWDSPTPEADAEVLL
ncbi:MAG TPA: AI-2E family transporter [Verrucomicrobiae bacterium]|nr:AI-2E family transporter [Verrucomicrobiae bacterium]